MDTVQFDHKNITNPTIIHANKVMNTITDCVKAVQGIPNSSTKLKIRNLKQLEKLTKCTIAHNPSRMSAEASNIRQHLMRVQPVLRVPILTSNNSRCLIRAMTGETQPVLRVPTSAP